MKRAREDRSEDSLPRHGERYVGVGIHPVCAESESTSSGLDAPVEHVARVRDTAPFGDKGPVTVVDVSGVLAATQAGVEDHDGPTVDDEAYGGPEVLEKAAGEVTEHGLEVGFVEEDVVVFLHVPRRSSSCVGRCEEWAGSKVTEDVGLGTRRSYSDGTLAQGMVWTKPETFRVLIKNAERCRNERQRSRQLLRSTIRVVTSRRRGSTGTTDAQDKRIPRG